MNAASITLIDDESSLAYRPESSRRLMGVVSGRRMGLFRNNMYVCIKAICMFQVNSSIAEFCDDVINSLARTGSIIWIGGV